MIDVIRSKVPAYKGTTQPTTSGAGMLSGFWCYLFGGGAVPAYRGAKEGGATAPVVSRCWWSLTGSPQYKTPPPPSVPDDAPCDGTQTGDAPAIGREFYVYPAE